MSRTFRNVSQQQKTFYKKDKVNDGSYTKYTRSCENHGGCPYCESNRLHKHRKKIVEKINHLMID